MRLRLALLALAALAVLYAVVPASLWAQVTPGQLVTIGCGKVVSCEALPPGAATPTPLPTCPAGLLLVGPGEPGSTCGTPQPTSTPRVTDTPIPADTPRPTDTPAPTETREARGFAFSTATPATGCIEAATSIAQIDCVAPAVAITPAPTSTPIPPVSTATPRSTDTPIPPVATATREAQGFAFSTATPATGCIEAAVSTGQIDCIAPGTAITPAPTSTPRATDTPIPADTLVPTATPRSTATPELYLQATTATPGPSTYLFYAGTPGPAIWVTPVPATPRPTDTPIPAPTARATDTPIPAPTAFPTLAVGQLIVGTGGQGVQNGNVNFTTATPVANSFPFCPGGGGTACTYATQVPTATIIATATPRATDTPIPTPTALTSSSTNQGLFLIADTTLGSTTASITFSSIPTTYKHLELIFSGRTDRASTFDGVSFQLNSDTSAHYDSQLLTSTVTTVAAAGATAASSLDTLRIAGDSATASMVGSGTVFFADYASTTLFKGVSWNSGSQGGTYSGSGGGGFRSTAAITTIKLFPTVGANFKTATRATLYGQN